MVSAEPAIALDPGDIAVTAQAVLGLIHFVVGYVDAEYIESTDLSSPDTAS
jgi:hypothetical protein